MKPRQEKIDRLVRQRLIEADRSGSHGSLGGDWDLPSEQVWASIESRIHKNPQNRRVLWWIFGGLVVLTIGMLLLLQFHDQPATREVDVVDTSHSSDVESVENVARLLQSAGSAVEATPIQPTHIETPETKVIPGTTRISITQPLSAKEATNSTKPVVENPATPEIAGNISYAEGTVGLNSSAIAGITPGSKSESETPLRSLEIVSFVHSEIPSVTSGKRELFPTNKSPFISRPTQSAWAIGTTLSPSLGTRRVVVPAAQPRVRRDLLLQQEEPAVQLGLGVSVLRTLSRRWSLEGGMEYNRFLLSSSSTYQIRYTRIGETQNARGNFENRFRMNLNTSYGDLSTDVVVERSSDSQIEEHRFINLALQTRQTMKMLQIPVSLRYRIPFGTWHVSGYGGLSANVLLENSLEFRAIQSLDREIIQTRTLPVARLSGYRDFALGYQFGIGIEVPLDQQWSVLAGPSVSGYFQPVYRSRQVIIYPLMADLHIGVRYRL